MQQLPDSWSMNIPEYVPVNSNTMLKWHSQAALRHVMVKNGNFSYDLCYSHCAITTLVVCILLWAHLSSWFTVRGFPRRLRSISIGQSAVRNIQPSKISWIGFPIHNWGPPQACLPLRQNNNISTALGIIISMMRTVCVLPGSVNVLLLTLYRKCPKVTFSYDPWDTPVK